MDENEVDYDYVFCLRCNRKLTDKVSAERGMGPVCYKKHNAEIAEQEFLKNQMTIDEVE